MPTHEASVVTLAAEVRVLMMGSRQVTRSVYRQLDHCEPGALEPFGRVSVQRPSKGFDINTDGIALIGRSKKTGALVRTLVPWDYQYGGDYRQFPTEEQEEVRDLRKNYWTYAARQPLIVLAG